MKLTDALVQCLENEGVEYIFGMVGTEILDLANSLSKSSKIKYINVRHEQGAAFMADVYGRLSKKAGICLSTLGPGAANLVTGIASAQLDHSPLIALIGQAGVERQHNESHQFINIVRLLEPATKWSTQIQDPKTAPAVIRKAFRLTRMEKPGAVAIILPENFAAEQITNAPLPVTSIPETVPDSESLNAAQQLIQKYQKPFIIIGNGVIRQNAASELETFINILQCPAAHSFMAKGILPKDHPLNFFTFGFKENDAILPSINDADLLIVIGFDFVEQLPNAWNKNKLPVLHLDTLPAEVNEFYPVECELVGNIKKTINILNKTELTAKPWASSGELHAQIKKTCQINQQPDESLSIENVLHLIEKHSSEDTIVLSDVGAHKVSIAKTYQPKKPNRLIISNGLATMGIAIPGAIGAKLACPANPVICITGDGGALMNFAEMETAKRLGLAFTIIVLDDSMLKLEVKQMNQKFGDDYGVTFQNPDFIQLAQSFGVKGIRPKSISELESILKEPQQEMVLIDLVTQNSE
ncbi:acetolactate synthase large subunit [Neobacillus cucumis]|uniref:Acetolactate synthase large subunit n=1 Tax=Neobacillus cucumis TaxID=1740721 RepID=A0A2N5HSN3_9BACI|nr:acetolactate synthase large subunit [Neobacillus cucumis]PLS08529.1 acetolactate synthase large subunit [Neobacillus cucumis]